MFNIHYFRFYLVAVLMWPYIFTNAYYYCDKQDKLCGDKKHFMCDPDAVPSEEEFLGLLPLTGSIKRLYVDRHNEYRNKLAGGEQNFKGDGKFPKATRMREMIWDDELAYLAGMHAKRCHLKRADCYATARFPSSGQNLFVTYFFEKPEKVIDTLLEAVDHWWQESQYIQDGNAMADEYPKGNMDADMISPPTPTVRSTVAVPRSGITPVATPRTTVAAAAARTRALSTPMLPPLTSPTPLIEPPRMRCPLCCRAHRLQHCTIFKGMPPQQRQQVAQAHGHCLNCLTRTHATQDCRSNNRCMVCMRSHHTLLHRITKSVVGRPPAQRSRNARQRPRTNQTPRSRPSIIPEARRSPPRHRQARSNSRRSTGLSNVVATLQQLQRLLG